MAAGSIILDLLMRTGSFQTDTDRARKKLQLLKKDAIEAGKSLALGIAGVGVAAAGAFAALDAAANSIAKYQELADQMGDTAENAASLQLAVDQSGVAFENVSAASVKLTSALASIEDDSKGAGAALKAMGLPLAEFQRLAPVDQMKAVADALSGIDDGATRTALAVQLFGRSGAQLIPFLNDLAERSEDQIQLTGQQIEAADRFSKGIATLRSEVKTAAQVMLADLFPALNTVFEEFAGGSSKVDLVAAASKTLREEFASLVNGLAFVKNGVEQAGLVLGAYFAVLRSGFTSGYQEFRNQAAAIGEALREDLARSDAALASFQSRVANASNLARIQSDPTELARRGRPVASPRGAPPAVRVPSGGGGGRAGGERVSEAQRYLDNLQKQLEGTRQLTTVETVLADLQAGRLKLAGNVTQAQLLDVAQRIDSAKALTSQLDAEKRQEQELADVQLRRAADLQSLFEATRTPAEQLAAELERINQITNFGKDNWDVYTRAVFAAQDAFDSATERAKAAASELDEFSKNGAKAIQGALGEELSKALDGNFKDIGDSFVRLLKRMAIEAVAADVTRKLFGGGDAGGGLLGQIGSSVLGFFGGAKAGGGDVLPGRPLLVGERGAEMFVPRTAGRILTADQVTGGRRGGGSTVNNISLALPQGMTRQTGQQIGAQIAREISRANARNN